MDGISRRQLVALSVTGGAAFLATLGCADQADPSQELTYVDIDAFLENF